MLVTVCTLPRAQETLEPYGLPLPHASPPDYAFGQISRGRKEHDRVQLTYTGGQGLLYE